MNHFIVGDMTPLQRVLDIETVFGPIDGSESFIAVTDPGVANMAVMAGVFKSKGQSRKSGMTGSAPPGLSLLGTKKNRFWVWNPEGTEDNVTLSSAFIHKIHAINSEEE